MSGCCEPDDYAKVFTPRRARRTVRRYLGHGLEGTALELARAIERTGIEDSAVIEIGGGAGTIQVELLRAGAASAVNVELSPGWEAPAAELIREVGVGDRIERRLGDFVAIAPTLDVADVVVLHRVVCCYPSWEPMLTGAAALSRRAIGLTFPVDRWWARWSIAAGNLFIRATGCGYRGYVHPAGAMIDVLRSVGFTTTYDRSRLTWRTVVLVR